MFPGIQTHMVFIIFNFLHDFKITVSNLEHTVHFSKLWEGESVNWKPDKEGNQGPEGILVSWLCGCPKAPWW